MKLDSTNVYSLIHSYFKRTDAVKRKNPDFLKVRVFPRFRDMLFHLHSNLCKPRPILSSHDGFHVPINPTRAIGWELRYDLCKFWFFIGFCVCSGLFITILQKVFALVLIFYHFFSGLVDFFSWATKFI